MLRTFLIEALNTEEVNFCEACNLLFIVIEKRVFWYRIESFFKRIEVSIDIVADKNKTF